VCGLLGIVGREKLSPDLASKVGSLLHHRGPDDSGQWEDSNLNVLFAHNRLAVQDLSALGHQPMVSRSGRYVLIYNGEIYNFLELRKELEREQVEFRGSSDTEVLLEAIAAWGLEQTLAKINGMFALALWDRAEKTLCLVRDRVGIKPLYYGWTPLGFQFASELKGIFFDQRIKLPLAKEAIELFFQYGYIPWPYSIFQNIYKLPPATFISFKFEELLAQPVAYSGFISDSEQIGPKRYWSFEDTGEKPETFTSESNAIDQLDALLEDSVRKRLIADVPVGAFLSGGIDSSLVVSKMTQLIPGKVKTFSVGFKESGYDESKYAELVAKSLGTEHHALRVSADEAKDVLLRIPEIYDEPFADSSQLPTYLVSKFAREQVTVCLSGDGGDELFGGYPRYLWAHRLWRAFGVLPNSLRKKLAKLLCAVPAGPINALFELSSRLQPESLRSFKEPGEKLARLGVALQFETLVQMYSRLNRHWLEYHNLLPNTLTPCSGLSEIRPASSGSSDWLSQISGLDIETYLTDDILHKVDRASMAHALEVRVPLLDYRIIEFSRTIPPALKVKRGKTKYILRELLARSVPREAFERPKMGFGIPLGEWLREDFCLMVDELVSEEYPATLSSFIDMSVVRQSWEQHRRGTKNWEYPIWNVVIFLMWYREWKANIAG